MQEKKPTLSTEKELARFRACVEMAAKRRHHIPIPKPQMQSMLGIEVSHCSS
jgi:hypothetical protein